MKNRVDFFIAKRISSAKERRRDGVMSRVATASIAICIGVMLIATFIVRGFQDTISVKITGLLSHIDIVNFENRYSEEPKPIDKNLAYLGAVKEKEYVKNVFPYAIKAGVLKSQDDVKGVVLRGLDSLYNTSFLEPFLVEGTLPDFASKEKKKEILISQNIASVLSLKVGDKAEMLFVDETPLRDRFTVTGIYSTSFGEYDDINVVTDLRNVQRLNGWNADEVSGVSVVLTDLKELEQAREEIGEIVDGNDDTEHGENLIDIKERFGDIFEWLKMQDVNETVILTIMIIVSAFNMITMMLILLLQKTAMIGVFKSMGMRDGTIRNIFILRLTKITFYGMLYGNIGAIALSLIQKHYSLLKLSGDGYMLSVVPIEINLVDILIINMITFIVLTLLQLIPTMLISRLAPYKSLKYDK